MVKRLLFFLLIILLGSPVFAQLEVKEGSFKKVEGFVNINMDKQTDDNDRPYAVLKIRTENIDGKQRRELDFKGDARTFFEVEYKDGEVWLYISYYASYIKISHDDLSSTEFYFPFDMEPKCGYELTLVNKVAAPVAPVPVKEQYNYLIVKAEQQNALIYIDDVYVGDGQVSKSFKVGETHNWRIECKMYHPESGQVTITFPDKVKVERNLRPAFGYLNVTSQPESGATVLIDGDRVGVTPYKSERLASGEHKVQVIKEMYSPSEQTFMVTDGNTTEAAMTMSANFASITVTTDSQSDIYIDNEKMGKGSWNGRLSAGDHVFEAKKASHRTSMKTATLSLGQTATIVIDNPTPIYGTIDVNTDPMECVIIIDGVRKGESPAMIGDVLIGNHEIKIEKKGYKPIKKNISLTEDKTLTVNEKLEKGGIMPEGLVAYYPFDGNANDMSGRGHHGTIKGNVQLTTGRKNDPNGAYQFPGQAMNYIQVSDHADLNNNNFTINAWVYTDRNNYQYNYIVDKGRDISNGTYRLCVDGVGACVKYNGSNGASVKNIPSVGKWHMVTGTVSGRTAKYYLDGVLLSEQTLSEIFQCSTSDPLTIGMHYYKGCPANWAYPYYGKIDDLSIFNRALTAEEIAELYTMDDATSVSGNTASQTTYYNAPTAAANDLPSGLVAYYPFDGNANDMSGRGHHGTIKGNVQLTTGRKNDPNGAYQFPGQAMNYIHVDNHADLNNSSFTINAWVYSDRDNYQRNYIVDKGRDISDGSYRLTTTGVGANVKYNTSNGTGIKTAPKTGQWHMITGTITGRKAKFYVDGELVAEDNLAAEYRCNTSDPLTIGMHYYNGCPASWAYPYYGKIDDLSIYNRVLSAEEIRDLYKK